MIKNFITIFLLVNCSFVHMNFENYVSNRNEIIPDESENINFNTNNKWEFRSKKGLDKKPIANKTFSSDNSCDLRKLEIKNYINVTVNNTIRTELLNQFLALKIYEFSDKINMMAIPQFRVIFESVIKLIKKSKNENEDEEIIELSASSCSLEYAPKVINTGVPKCPWRWVVLRRVDKFPFKRSSVKCNCEKCQSKAISNSDLSSLSICEPTYSFYPMLIRETILNGVEKWSFALEEIANSCVCSLRLNSQ